MSLRAGAGGLIGLLIALASSTVAAEESVSFPSLDRAGVSPVVLVARWFPAQATPAPAVVLLHGCGGAVDRRGHLTRRLAETAAFLNEHGFHALVVDSLTPRSETEICTQRVGKRRVTQLNRRRDALAAIDWLARRSDVALDRIGLLGWSNGGSTVLSVTNRRHPEVAAAAVQPAFAIAFYPGCEAELRRGYDTSTALLMLVGEADDWTPAAPCHRLAEQADHVRPEIEGYAGAFHGFDSEAPVRLRTDVPNGVHPGMGVHVGRNADALRRSRDRLSAVLARQCAGGRSV
ncbi:MAG: dienelactone hydrolase family protein, partial [Caldimonas sp.]